MTTALYLAHLNPVTCAHVEIINELKAQADSVCVMPVLFVKGDAEVNSRSFPFGFEVRKKMIESIFGDTVTVSRNYAFFAPFSRYMPPLISPGSWRLRRQILAGIRGDYFTYTGDRAEGYMLKLYRLRPRVGSRKAISASSVKSEMYDAANGADSDWERQVPGEVVGIVREHWDVVEGFADAEDRTVRIAGMKFPKDGWSK